MPIAIFWGRRVNLAGWPVLGPARQHSAQGRTAERVLVNADTIVHPELLNSRFGYVSISRSSRETTLFTNDMNKLIPQITTDVSKTSAVEISQNAPLALILFT
jgi:ATP-dependent exoDNAse (exonuclease V) alpha subunit